MLETVKGAKGGSQSQRQPKVANDTTASKTYARLQYGMSEGEVEGLANGYKSIYLDDTPVENDSGARNFQDVTLDFRSGTNDQTYMEGFESIASETAVGVELKSDTPWVKGITNLTLDAVIVRVRFGALKQQDPKNGDVSGIVIDYTIEVQTDGGSWELMLDTQMSGKTSANYERTHRIGLPKANNNWLIRVTRKTPNSSSEYVSDKMYIQAITEVVDLKLAYPNTALIGVQYDAETFSNIAKIAVDLKGVKIKVPSNYDPVSRTYIGIWDGLFKRAYSNNPAWIYYDLCTNKRYALGNRLTEQMIDKWSLYRLAQYCDQLVPDGKGGQEPRFACNVYIQSAESAFDILSKLAGLFRAISYWDGASIVCEADLPQDTMFTYTSANIIDGAMGINYTGTRARDRHNAVKVAWDNPQNRYKTEYVFVRDEKSIAEARTVRLLELEAWGCTSEGQAQRTGQWALKTEQLETRTVTFKVGLDGYIPLPGKVIELADELLAGRANGGRISSVSADLKQITLDRDDVVCRAGDRLVVNGEDGKAQARVVSSIAGRIVTVVSAFDSVAAQNVWVIDAQDLATMKFRVVSISQDEPHQFTINAIQHNDSKFDAIDHGAFIDDRPISIINPTTQAPVESVTISSEQMVQQGMSVETMVISWPQAKDATKYQVEWRKDNGTWLKLPLTGNNSAEVAGIYAGQYEARVFAISAFDISSLPTYSVLTELKGKQGKPPKLANIHAEGILFGMKLTWLFPAVGALDTAYTEIEVSPDSTSNIAQLGLFAYPTTVHTIQGMQPNLRQYYRGRLIDRIGNVGDWSDWVSGVSSADASDVLDLLNDQISESQLNQDLKEKIERIEVIDGDIADIIQAVQNVENGITQERNERIAGDDQVLNQLTIYKLSNDQKVAAVVEDVDLVMNEQEVQAKKIDGVYAQVNPPLIGSESDLIGNNSGYAGVWSEQSARIEGDLAQSIRTDQVVAQMNQNDALYQQQIKATADAVSANVRLTETLQTTVGENKASIERVSESVDGVYAQEFTKFDVNGHVAGHGAMNDGKVSRFTFNYDSIDFGAPVGVDGIEVRPLMVLQNTPITLPNGTVVPRGMYVEMANIGYVHANRIYADSLSAISADLGTIKVKEANIDDLAVSTLKIKDNAVTVPIGIKLATPIQKNTQRSATAFTGGDAVILDTSNYFGDIISLSLNRSGGKCQISGYVYVDNVCASAWRSNGSTVSNAPKTMYCGVVLYRNGSPIFIGRVASSSETTNDVAVFNGAVQLPTIIDDAYSGNVQYSIRVGWSTSISDAGLMIRPWNTGNASVLTATLSVLELKK
ncbi:host specificity protein J [Acinetobacter bereziniae]|uniref:host specificity protein J n=3 Tax=Acinetobacter bereziniae TaxID=106648 RepID=UPI0015D9C30A|nr:phage tail protein [Acinetobacter bereziniae]